jgi:hypothetical protein
VRRSRRCDARSREERSITRNISTRSSFVHEVGTYLRDLAIDVFGLGSHRGIQCSSGVVNVQIEAEFFLIRTCPLNFALQPVCFLELTLCIEVGLPILVCTAAPNDVLKLRLATAERIPHFSDSNSG